MAMEHTCERQHRAGEHCRKHGGLVFGATDRDEFSSITQNKRMAARERAKAR